MNIRQFTYPSVLTYLDGSGRTFFHQDKKVGDIKIKASGFSQPAYPNVKLIGFAHLQVGYRKTEP
jgi:hypothetical protein